MPLPLNRLYLAHTLSEPRLGPEGALFYVRQIEANKYIYRQSLVTGLAQPLTAEPAPSGGVGYGGGLYAVHGDVLVYAARGGRLVGVDLTTAAQWNVTPPYRSGDLTVMKNRSVVGLGHRITS